MNQNSFLGEIGIMVSKWNEGGLWIEVQFSLYLRLSVCPSICLYESASSTTFVVLKGDFLNWHFLFCYFSLKDNPLLKYSLTSFHFIIKKFITKSWSLLLRGFLQNTLENSKIGTRYYLYTHFLSLHLRISYYTWMLRKFKSCFILFHKFRHFDFSDQSSPHFVQF